MSELKELPDLSAVWSYVGRNQVAAELGFDSATIDPEENSTIDAVLYARVQQVASLALSEFHSRRQAMINSRHEAEEKIYEIDATFAELTILEPIEVDRPDEYSRYVQMWHRVRTAEDFQIEVEDEQPFTLLLDNYVEDMSEIKPNFSLLDWVRNHFSEIRVLANEKFSDPKLLRQVAFASKAFNLNQVVGGLSNKEVIEFVEVDQNIGLLHVHKPTSFFEYLLSDAKGLGPRSAIALLVLAKFQEPFVIEALYKKDELDNYQA